MNVAHYLENVDLRQTKMIGFGAVFLSIIGLWFYMLSPVVKSYGETRKAHNVLQQVVASETDLGEQLSTERKNVEELDSRLYGDMINLPPKQMEHYVIARLQKISWNNGVEFAGVTPKQGETIETFQEMLFNVEIRGSYANLYLWFRGLAQNLGFIVIKEFEMRPVDHKQEPPKLTVRLTMATYRSIQK